MSIIFADGFDKYGPVGLASDGSYGGSYPGNSTSGTPLLPQLMTEWDVFYFGASSWNFGGSFDLVPGLHGSGTALRIAGNPTIGGQNFIKKYLAQDLPTICGGVWIDSGHEHNAGVAFFDGSTMQCYIQINRYTGAISLCSGDYSGSTTVLATSYDAMGQGAANILEWSIGIGTSAPYTIYLNKKVILTGTANTKTSANSYVNKVSLYINQSNVSYRDYTTFDNFYIDDTAPLLDYTFVDTSFPNADSSVQFTRTTAVLGVNYSNTNATSTASSNTLYLRRVQAPSNGTVINISAIPTAYSSTTQFRPTMYADNAGAVGSLLSAGSVVTGCSGSATLVMPLTTPQAITTGTYYWVGFMCNASTTFQDSDASSVAVGTSATFSSGAPSSPSGFSSQASISMWGVYTPSANWPSQAVVPDIFGGNYNIVSTVGYADYFQFPVLSGTSADIHAIYVKCLGQDSSDGSRAIALHAKSSGTDSTGTPSVQPAYITPKWLASKFITDPNTGSSWTDTGVNNATFGVSLAA